MIGFDTGFFVKLLRGHSHAQQLWRQVAANEQAAAISCITLYELQRLGLRGIVAKSAVDTLLDELPNLCDVVWLSSDVQLREAARIAHGNGLAMADAIILTSLTAAGSTHVYTTDSDLQRYGAGPEVVLL